MRMTVLTTNAAERNGREIKGYEEDLRHFNPLVERISFVVPDSIGHPVVS